jgi:hypothetical protein
MTAAAPSGVVEDGDDSVSRLLARLSFSATPLGRRSAGDSEWSQLLQSCLSRHRSSLRRKFRRYDAPSVLRD